jgi:hypothetical protein
MFLSNAMRMVATVTFEELQQAIARLSPAERMDLYRTCPATHPPDKLLALERHGSSGVLRYCARCLVIIAADGRALNAPGRRWER